MATVSYLKEKHYAVNEIEAIDNEITIKSNAIIQPPAVNVCGHYVRSGGSTIDFGTSWVQLDLTANTTVYETIPMLGLNSTHPSALVIPSDGYYLINYSTATISGGGASNANFIELDIDRNAKLTSVFSQGIRQMHVTSASNTINATFIYYFEKDDFIRTYIRSSFGAFRIPNGSSVWGALRITILKLSN